MNLKKMKVRPKRYPGGYMYKAEFGYNEKNSKFLICHRSFILRARGAFTMKPKKLKNQGFSFSGYLPNTLEGLLQCVYTATLFCKIGKIKIFVLQLIKTTLQINLFLPLIYCCANCIRSAEGILRIQLMGSWVGNSI